MHYRTMTVALEGDPDEVHVIRESIRLARELGADLTVLHVNPPGADAPHMMMDAPRSVDEDELRSLIRKAGHAEVAERMTIRIEEGDPYQDVIAAAAEAADLLVVGHDPKHPFVAALTPGVDKKIANVAPCPVLVVPRR